MARPWRFQATDPLLLELPTLRLFLEGHYPKRLASYGPDVLKTLAQKAMEFARELAQHVSRLGLSPDTQREVLLSLNRGFSRGLQYADWVTGKHGALDPGFLSQEILRHMAKEAFKALAPHVSPSDLEPLFPYIGHASPAYPLAPELIGAAYEHLRLAAKNALGDVFGLDDVVHFVFIDHIKDIHKFLDSLRGLPWTTITNALKRWASEWVQENVDVIRRKLQEASASPTLTRGPGSELYEGVFEVWQDAVREILPGIDIDTIHEVWSKYEAEIEKEVDKFFEVPWSLLGKPLREWAKDWVLRHIDAFKEAWKR